MHLRLIDRWNCKAQLQWEPRDVWVGLFWRITHEDESWRFLHLYICVVPLLPLHITMLRKIKAHMRGGA